MEFPEFVEPNQTNSNLVQAATLRCETAPRHKIMLTKLLRCFQEIKPPLSDDAVKNIYGKAG
jgi:hypothetical protein